MGVNLLMVWAVILMGLASVAIGLVIGIAFMVLSIMFPPDLEEYDDF